MCAMRQGSRSRLRLNAGLSTDGQYFTATWRADEQQDHARVGAALTALVGIGGIANHNVCCLLRL